MNAAAAAQNRAFLAAPALLGQVSQVRGLTAIERDALLVTMRRVDGEWVVVSRYADPVWWLSIPTTNSIKALTKLEFEKVAAPFRPIAKAVMYRLIRRGRDKYKRAGTAAIVKVFTVLLPFFEFVADLGVKSLSSISPTICKQYVEACRQSMTNPTDHDPVLLKPSGLYKRFSAVEALHELSQYTDEPMRSPWPNTTADYLSGYGRSKRDEGAKTPLMPDKVFEGIFQRASSILERADHLLDLRDYVDGLTFPPLSAPALLARKNNALALMGWDQGLGQLRSDLLELRTACYVVIASLSGCRNHEISFLKEKAYYSTEDATGTTHWWMKSRSTKTGAGDTEWMVPPAAVDALRIMDRWAKPHQSMLLAEIDALRARDPRNIRIAEAHEHIGAVFVGVDKKRSRRVRTLGTRQWNSLLKEFARACGFEWGLATHHFRRKFANYAARSQFGDLRYLRQHFKHWSLDMSLHYALNEAQEMTLFLEIEDELEEIKEQVVGTWLDDGEPLGGGYGKGLINWRSRSETVAMFKSKAHMVRSVAQSTAIRSNGHAWCTADDNLCTGNDLEPTRCSSGCESAVVGRGHANIYQRLHDDLVELAETPDIGPGGRARVERDLSRCKQVLGELGFTPAASPQPSST
ncbi:hypothetical protein [Variovorax atrisoli]|uniref:hypothetical protein n=1 Tax=Variovorax atrisoli TaxID=3394203 RepID=UPI003392DF2C